MPLKTPPFFEAIRSGKGPDGKPSPLVKLDQALARLKAANVELLVRERNMSKAASDQGTPDSELAFAKGKLDMAEKELRDAVSQALVAWGELNRS